MKNILSFSACVLISISLFYYRVYYPGIQYQSPLKVTTWDALGYYIYLPAIFIYNDTKELKWVQEIDNKYSVSGGRLYQANKHKSGNYVFKYLGGVAVLESPFFLIGHLIAKYTSFEEDGFSAPYQYAIAFGILFYCILAVFILRKILLVFFTDHTVACTLILTMIATNIIQYAAIDNAMSHGVIFLLYVLILYTTVKWHQRPGVFWASFGGFILGLSTICRPTEAIMLFIPLLWNTHSKSHSKEKWELVKKHKKHVLVAVLFAILAVLPQLIYWQTATGFFIYDVGSKWRFLNPFFRVLFGWEKGWFIYTPVTVFFVMGFFFIKEYPFRKSVIYFCLLNIWIVISWFDWRYGASYSTRALSQSYPVFALPLAALIEKINFKRWKYLFYIAGIYLVYVNLFQIKQYNATILHYDHMNRKYYSRIYLNNNPSPLDMSLLDTDEFLENEENYRKKLILEIKEIRPIRFEGDSFILAQVSIDGKSSQKESWLKIESEIKVDNGLPDSYLNGELTNTETVKSNKIRLFNPISPAGCNNKYAFYMKIPPAKGEVSDFKLYITSPHIFEGEVNDVKITYLY